MRHCLFSSILSLIFATAAVAAPHNAHFGENHPSGSSGFSLHHGWVDSKHWPSKTTPESTTSSLPQPTTDAAGSSSSAASNGTHESGGEEYVVLFNSSHPSLPEVEHVLNRLELHSNHSDVLRVYNNSAFRGFSARMKSHCLDKLNAMVEVERVEASAKVFSSHIIRNRKLQTEGAADTKRDTVTVLAQGSATWGLQRISNSASMDGADPKSALDFTYMYTDASLGAGVDIYIVDTGINLAHTAFQGRAKLGFSFNSSDSGDGDGHGTHTAGTAAGEYFGVAPGANLIAVKVLGDDGSGSSSDVLAGIDWVINNHDSRKTQNGFVASVMSMSWGLGGVQSSIDAAITQAVSSGIHASVAAGNEGSDSCSQSPSDLGGSNSAVITVGSVNIDNEVSSFSNTGACNDIYAPGEDVLSAYIGSDNILQYLSGTSMACPHVSGMIAYLAADNATLASDPQAMKDYIKSTALQGKISGSTNDGDPMLLLNNGVLGTGTSSYKKRSIAQDEVKIRNPSPLTGLMERVYTFPGKTSVKAATGFVLKSREAKLAY